VAAGRRLRTSSIVGLLVVMLVVTVGAGALALQRGPFYEREEAAKLPRIDVSAKDLAFDTKTLELSPAGAVISFTNADTQPHNIAIYPSADKLTEPFFKGEITAGGQKRRPPDDEREGRREERDRISRARLDADPLQVDAHDHIAVEVLLGVVYPVLLGPRARIRHHVREYERLDAVARGGTGRVLGARVVTKDPGSVAHELSSEHGLDVSVRAFA
jgi:plastocyanin